MFYRGLMVLITMIFSLVVKADFNYEGNGKLIYPTGVKTDLKFGFKVQKTDNGYTFVAGNQEMKVSHVPEKYSIWLSMNPERGVFIQEFSNNYFKEFEWQLGEHKLSLKKKVLTPKRAPGDYLLTINDIDYFFKGKQSAINILFNEEGISTIEVSGFVRNFGVSE